LVKRESDRNPTSGLPGGRAIREEIERRVERGQGNGEPFAICYIDLDHFKPFADTFGFVIADELIAGTATALCDAVKAAVQQAAVENDGSFDPLTEEPFIGHIGGDDFLILTSPAASARIAAECNVRFAQAVADVMGEDMAKGGTFQGKNRQGESAVFPLASLTTAVLVVDPRDWVSISHIGTFAAEVKQRQKLHRN
jgi:GGDEF domain-containing protein